MSKTVLLVEIESAVRRLLRLRFELAGLTVVDAPTGERGLAAFQAHRGSVVAVVSGELSAPLDGLGLLAALRELDPDLPVFFFLSHSLPHDLIQSGVEVFMKPYGLGNLCRSIVETASRAGDDPRPILAGRF